MWLEIYTCDQKLQINGMREYSWLFRPILFLCHFSAVGASRMPAATKEAEQTLCSGGGKLWDWTVREPDHKWMYATIYETHRPENSMN